MFKSPVYHSRIHKSPVYHSMPGIVAAGEVSTHALSFDGTDDYVSLGTSASLSPANLSFSVWLKASGSPALYDGVIGRSTNTSWQDGWGMFWQSSSELRFFVGKYDVNYAAKTGVTAGNWNHVCGTWDGTTVKIYVNGSIGSNGSQSGSQTATTEHMDIGRLDSNLYNFAGILDDLRIYNVALTAPQIAAMYANTTPAPTAGLVGHWKFDEGSGTNAADSSGNGNNGTLTNGPTWTTDVPPQLAA